MHTLAESWSGSQSSGVLASNSKAVTTSSNKLPSATAEEKGRELVEAVQRFAKTR